MRTSHGFTLIELLMVILIITILASLILTAVVALRDSAEEFDTKRRLENIQNSLVQAGGGGQTTGSLIQDLAWNRHPEADFRQPLRFDNLRTILTALTETYGLVLDYDRTARETSRDAQRWPTSGLTHLPPNLGCLYDSDGATLWTGTWPGSSLATDHSRTESGIGIARSTSYGTAWYWFPLRLEPELGLLYKDITPYAKSHELDNIMLFESVKNFAIDVAYDPPTTGTTLFDYQWWWSGTGTVPFAYTLPYLIDAGAGRTHNFWFHFSDPPFSASDAEAEADRHCRLYDRRSPIGETLNGTLEVMPPGIVERSWYYELWPELVETEVDGVLYQRFQDYGGRDRQAANWNQDPPDPMPLVWPVPFGRRIMARSTGELVEQFWRKAADAEPRTLADFSPLLSLDLLRLAEIVPDRMVSDYRQDRNPKKEWNDAWGNPLFVTYATYVAPRYDLDQFQGDALSQPLYSQKLTDVGTALREFTGTLSGGRDWFLRRARETYGAPRLSYTAVGAVGEVRTVVDPTGDNTILDEIPSWDSRSQLTWTEAQDDRVYRALWLQVRDVCRAARWTDAAFENPPWNGVLKARRGEQQCFLSTPLELK